MRRVVCAVVAAVLLVVAPAWATTTLYVRTDSTAGGDGSVCTASGATRAYPSLKLAVDGLPATLTTDYVIEICNPAGAPEDTTSIASTPWDMTTTATNFLTVRTDANNRATSPMDTSRYVLHCTNPATGCLYNNLPDHIRIDGLQIKMTVSDGGGYVALKGSNANETASDIDVRLTNNVVRCEITGAVGSTIGIESRWPSGGASAPGVNYVVNNVVVGCRTGIDNDWAGSRLYNNTAYQNIFNFSDSGVGVWRNNLSQLPLSSNGIGFVGTYASGTSHNAADDGAPPGTSGKTCTATFADAGISNLHLASGDTCAKDSGVTDPQGSGLFNADLDQVTKSGTWDIGADEYGVTIALTGTVAAAITEADIVTGGKTIILTATGETFVPSSRAGLQYVGGQVGGFAGTTSDTTVNFSLSNGLATLPDANDLVVVAFCTGSTVDRTLDIRNAAAGTAYTLIGSELYSNDTFDTNMRVAYRFMPGTPETAVTFQGGTGAAADAGEYAIHVFRGVDSGTPLDVAAVTATGIDTRLANPGSITPTTAGAWIEAVGCGAAATGGTYTVDYAGDLRAGSTAGTNDAQVGSGYREWSSGAYDPAAFTGGGTDTVNDSWGAVTIALRPTVTTPFATDRANLRNGCDSAQSEAAGWDAKVKGNIPVANVVRTSNTVATITLQAQADYDITATETITCTVPATSLASGGAVAASPTFTITAAGGSATRLLLLMGVGQ